ncbi:MAG TPA: hypothetical protein PLL10_07065, partial [Elusimicrobiales bacterium]|nr:hypothetical protein [Elusimicrobiales bacterium]
EKIFVWKTAVSNNARFGAPGTAVALQPLQIACGENSNLELLRLQPEGGAEISGAEFAAKRGLAVNAKILRQG